MYKTFWFEKGMVFFLGTNQKRHNSLRNENKKTRQALLTTTRAFLSWAQVSHVWQRIFLCRVMGSRRFVSSSWTFVSLSLAASNFKCDVSTADRMGGRHIFYPRGKTFLGWWRDGLSFLWRWFWWWHWWSRFCLFCWANGSCFSRWWMKIAWCLDGF